MPWTAVSSAWTPFGPYGNFFLILHWNLSFLWSSSKLPALRPNELPCWVFQRHFIPISWALHTLCCEIFFFLNGRTSSVWKFLGQGSNPSHCWDLHHSCSNARSSTTVPQWELTSMHSYTKSPHPHSPLCLNLSCDQQKAWCLEAVRELKRLIDQLVIRY